MASVPANNDSDFPSLGAAATTAATKESRDKLRAIAEKEKKEKAKKLELEKRQQQPREQPSPKFNRPPVPKSPKPKREGGATKSPNARKKHGGGNQTTRSLNLEPHVTTSAGGSDGRSDGGDTPSTSGETNGNFANDDADFMQVRAGGKAKHVDKSTGHFHQWKDGGEQSGWLLDQHQKTIFFKPKDLATGTT